MPLPVGHPEVVVDEGGAELGVLDGRVEERFCRKKGEVEEDSKAFKKFVVSGDNVLLKVPSYDYMNYIRNMIVIRLYR